MRKKIKHITFWLGVNIIGLPVFEEHKFNRKGNIIRIDKNLA